MINSLSSIYIYKYLNQMISGDALKLIQKVGIGPHCDMHKDNTDYGKKNVIGKWKIEYTSAEQKKELAPQFTPVEKEAKVKYISMITTSEIKISVVIKKDEMTKAVKALHNAFDLDKELDT